MRLNARCAIGPVAAPATESGLGKTAGPGTTGSPVSTEVDCDGFTVVVPLLCRQRWRFSLYRPTNNVDTGVRDYQS